MQSKTKQTQIKVSRRTRQQRKNTNRKDRPAKEKENEGCEEKEFWQDEEDHEDWIPDISGIFEIRIKTKIFTQRKE